MEADLPSEILYADDDPGMRALVGDVLQSGGFLPRVVASGTEALSAVRERKPALVILDYRMGRPDGFEVCRALKADARTEHIPVLILTAKGTTETRIAGFDAGADDYLPKPFDARELLGRVRALLRLSRQALDRNPTSSLPGGEAIHREYARRRENGDPMAVCYFDLDHFKPFGDRFGFAAADAVIREAAASIAVASGAEDFVGHVGGDDFLLICPPTRARATVEAAQLTFHDALPRHLPPGAAAAVYRGRDRAGVEGEIPMTRLTAAIIYLDPTKHRSLGELGEMIAHGKAAAKVTPTGVVETDAEGGGWGPEAEPGIPTEPEAPTGDQPSARRGGSPPESSGSESSRNS